MWPAWGDNKINTNGTLYTLSKPVLKILNDIKYLLHENDGLGPDMSD